MRILPGLIVAVGALSAAMPSAPAVGGLLVDHQPHNFGGLASDTDFINDGGAQRWQRIADDFILAQPTLLRAVNWWGFYGGDFTGSPDPPAGSETMRIRFYGARVSDGLPDDANILYEQAVLDPSRTATGRIIFTGFGPREFLFEADLAQPLALEGQTPYWLEIIQVGDVQSLFRWEFSLAERNGQAFINAATGNSWRSTLPNGDGDTAFQLIAVPEPCTALIGTLAWLLFQRRRQHRGTTLLRAPSQENEKRDRFDCLADSCVRRAGL